LVVFIFNSGCSIEFAANFKLDNKTDFNTIKKGVLPEQNTFKNSKIYSKSEIEIPKYKLFSYY
jgi:hypothetical protein